VRVGEKFVAYVISKHDMTLKENWVWNIAYWEDSRLKNEFQRYLEYKDAKRLLTTVEI
jgi:hypothetical protein